MFEIKRGNVVQMTSMTVRPNQHSSFTFRAPRGKQFVCLLLGVEDKLDEGEKLDCLAVMDQMGWTMKNKADYDAIRNQHKEIEEELRESAAT